jgi:hypothetical protein
LPRMPVAETPRDAVTLAFAGLGIAPGGRMETPVRLPTIHDQTASLRRLAEWVDALP